MAITQAIPVSFKLELTQGVHLSADVYKIALYTSSATLDATTTAYSATNEVVGAGYTAGGATLVGYSGSIVGSKAVLDWTTDPSWANATITARGALIYNSSKSNKAVYVMDFGADKTSTSGTFTVTLPVADATNGLIRIA